MIYGVMPVLESLRNAPSKLRKIYLADGRSDRRTDEIRNKARDLGVPIIRNSRGEIDQLFVREVNHQGTAAVVKNAELVSVEELIEGTTSQENALIAVLDEIQDPGNFGAIIRSAECAGLSGIIFTGRNSSGITETVVKTSAGAVEGVPLAKAGNLVSSLNLLKKAGYWVVGADAKGETSYSDWDFAGKTAIVLGSEGKGMRRLTAEKCDVLLNIPLRGKISSLNVSVTAGILFFEAVRHQTERK